MAALIATAMFFVIMVLYSPKMQEKLAQVIQVKPEMPYLSSISPTNSINQKGYMVTNTSDNSGASVSLMTQYTNGSTMESEWIGETLSNGAFIQVGYVIQNKTAWYKTANNQKGTLLKKGVPTWFWEYFPANEPNETVFYGDIGINGSVGLNGTYNIYSIRSKGNIWYIYLNNQTIGNVSLGANVSKSNLFIISESQKCSNIFLPIDYRNLNIFKNNTIV